MKNANHQNETQFNSNSNSQIPTRKSKKDFKKLNEHFFMSEEVKLQVQNRILKLENRVQNQAQLDQLCSEVKSLFLNELYLLYNARKNGNIAHKGELRTIYQQSQKTFDSKFWFFKRKHKKTEFEQLEVLAKMNPNKMWAKLNK